jgi:hypothetical protein
MPNVRRSTTAVNGGKGQANGALVVILAARGIEALNTPPFKPMDAITWMANLQAELTHKWAKYIPIAFALCAFLSLSAW